MPVFARGDVVNVPLDPAVGHAQRGTRPGLVLTGKGFNKLGDALVARITQGGDLARYAGFAVTLTETGCRTQGVALVNKVRTLDMVARKARKIERIPLPVQDALARLLGLLDCAWVYRSRRPSVPVRAAECGPDFVSLSLPATPPWPAVASMAARSPPARCLTQPVTDAAPRRRASAADSETRYQGHAAPCGRSPPPRPR